MKECWSQAPLDRPDFHSIADTLDRLLNAEVSCRDKHGDSLLLMMCAFNQTTTGVLFLLKKESKVCTSALPPAIQLY